jgi:ATP-dependent Clp protease adapter protein ClpS
MMFYTGRHFSPVRLGRHQNHDADEEPHNLYEVRIIDNDYNTYGQVMEISMRALDVTEAEAYGIAWEVDHNGACVVAQGPREEAEAIAGIIRTIGIEVQVNPIMVETS